MANFKLEDYEMVQDRLPKFYEKYEDGRIVTQLISNDNDIVVFKAVAYKDSDEQERGLILSTGWAMEKKGDGYVNKTSHLENCETSAIGRALANLTLHGNKRPSREEMEKVERMSKEEEKQNEKNRIDKLPDDIKDLFRQLQYKREAVYGFCEKFKWDEKEIKSQLENKLTKQA